MRVCVLIPCYNEELTIKETIDDFKKYIPIEDIIVCDNNSTDNTLRTALKCGARVITEKKQGKGFAMQTLFNYAKFRQYDIYIMVDGDNTYLASNVNELISKINGGYDMVVGQRDVYFEETKKLANVLGNKLLMFLLRKYKEEISDPLSGYRAFSKDFIEKYPCNVDGFDIEMDMNIWAIKNKMKMTSVIVPFQNRPEGSYSKINLKDGIKILCRLIKN